MSEKIPKEWKWVKLGEVADVRDGTHDSPKEAIDGKYLITSKHIKNGKIDFSKAYKISLDDFEAINKRSKVDKYDILFSMIGTIGEMVIVDFEPDFAIKNVGLFKTGNKDLSRWIYYYLKSNDAQAEIYASLKGSTQQYITLGDLRNFPILLPPLPEQKAIVEVLSSIDDKIDLLHRQNKTLEEMAMTLFRQWFIEPTKDGLPEGWEEVSLGEIIEISSGKSIEKGKLKEKGLYPVLGANGEIGRTDDWLYEGELIYTGRVGTLGNVFIVFRNEKVWLTDNTLVIKPKKNEYFYFVYFTLKNAKLDEYNSGSTQPLIRQSDIKKIEIFLPKINFLKDFEVISRNLFTKIQFNTSQIQTLDKLRDTLLPKLMSGELRVKV